MAFHSSCRQQRARHFFNLHLNTKNKIETKEISYTEDERYVSINISAAKEEISKENVIFKTLPAKLTPFLFPAFRPKPAKRRIAGRNRPKITPPEPDNIINHRSFTANETISRKVFNIIQVFESS